MFEKFYDESTYRSIIKKIMNNDDFIDDVLIYGNLKSNYSWKVAIIRDTLVSAVNLMPNMKLTGNYARLINIDKVYLNKIVKDHTNFNINTAFTIALVNSIILKWIYRDRPEYKMDKLCDVIYINTDKYDEMTIRKALMIMLSMNSLVFKLWGKKLLEEF